MCNCINKICREIHAKYRDKYKTEILVQPHRVTWMMFRVVKKIKKRRFGGITEVDWSRRGEYESRDYKYCPFCGKKIWEREGVK